jgi:hypothetical protein
VYWPPKVCNLQLSLVHSRSYQIPQKRHDTHAWI